MSQQSSSLTKAHTLIHNLRNENASALLLVADILYGVVLLFESFMPIGMLFAIVNIYNCLIMEVESTTFCRNTIYGTQRSEENRIATVGEICSYFPVDRNALRKAQYTQITKIICMQLIATVIGMSLVFPLADIGRILAVLGVLVLSMLAAGIYRVERGMRR